MEPVFFWRKDHAKTSVMCRSNAYRHRQFSRLAGECASGLNWAPPYPFINAQLLVCDASQIDEVILGARCCSARLWSEPGPASRRSMPVCPFSPPRADAEQLLWSGLKAVHHGHPAIRCGDAEIIICRRHGKYEPGTHVLPKVGAPACRMGHARLRTAC